MELIRWLQDLRIADVPQVGGKNASLGEMIGGLAEEHVPVPGGFATTADAFRQFITANKLDKRIHDALDKLDVEDVRALAETGKQIRQWVVDATFSTDFEKTLETAYKQLVEEYIRQRKLLAREGSTRWSYGGDDAAVFS